MAVGKGEFKLYSRIEPPLKAGTYRFTAEQQMSAQGLPVGSLPVDPLDTHVRVRSPQYVLPPDQVLSTYPPAGREGSYGSRLPQIVIRRRTLPWERKIDPGGPAARDDLPWLALVLIAEGEAELKSNLAVAETVTPGVVLDTPADAEKGNSLWIRRSAVHRIFPTQEEVGLLAHAREVDLNDTELMMGDDDGFLAVVIGNRLPLSGRNDDGREVPVKYLACLVNLCEQYDELLPEAPDPEPFTLKPKLLATTVSTVAGWDKQVMGMSASATSLPKAGPAGTTIREVAMDVPGAAPYEGQSGWASATQVRGMVDVYADMARDFGGHRLDLDFEVGTIDPVLRFPVLIHWSFTSYGQDTFRSLMEGLDSGLLGTRPEVPDPGADPGATSSERSAGRLPLEVVETGHVGLPHRLRRGDEVRSWYRSPLLAHPPDVDTERLPLAHSADQVRTVVPDGREDVTLAAAFEIGRLLGLSRPSMIAALLRWRQGGYQTARQDGIAGSGILAGIRELTDTVDRFLGGRAGALVAQALVDAPEQVLGNPAPLVNPGRPVLDGVSANAVLEDGLGLKRDLLSRGRAEVLVDLAEVKPRTPTREVPTGAGAAVLGDRVDTRFSRAAIQAIAPSLTEDVLTSGAVRDVPLDLGGILAGPAGGLGDVFGEVFGGVFGGVPGGVVGPGLPHGVAPHGVAGDALDRLVTLRHDDADDDEGGEG